MSRIGRLPIKIDPAVEVKLAGDLVSFKGPKGQLEQPLPGGITAQLEERSLHLVRRDDTKRQKALHGLARALLANAARGVHQGFTKSLEIHGVGYRADVSGQVLKLSLGYSHPVEFPLPEGIQVAVEEKNTRIRVSGCDRQQVGQVAADIRALRPPDVYKLKGIRYAGEHLRKKAGKTGAK